MAQVRELDETSRLLRRRVLQSLRRQGFSVRQGRYLSTASDSKEAYRELHRLSRETRIAQAKAGLARHEDRLLSYIANGSEISLSDFQPALREVRAKSEEELLFRYARLHWSIPVSAGYGRRLRFLVVDEANNKLIGIAGLGDPVYHLAPRDDWIGWDGDSHRRNLSRVMDAFVLGAVPPYSSLLCGKLVAMLLTSKEVDRAFARKYGGKKSVIDGRPHANRLALITTVSALGRSSIYNRMRFEDRQLFFPVGRTSGSGEFHFSNGVYKELSAFAQERCRPAAKNEAWGVGWRSKRELVRAVLPLLGLSRELVYHGVQREVFVVPLASNSREVLQGRQKRLRREQATAENLSTWFADRWLRPRAERDPSYLTFERESYRLWS